MAVSKTLGQFGRLDAVVVCAAPWSKPGLRTSALKSGSTPWLSTYGRPICWPRKRHQLCAARGAGRIVLTGSTSGLQGGVGTVAYATSKGGVIAMVRSLALAFAGSSVRVNCVAPGWVDTPFNDPHWPCREGAGDACALERHIPVGRRVPRTRSRQSSHRAALRRRMT